MVELVSLIQHVDESRRKITQLFQLAPLHNPANLEGNVASAFYIGKTNGCFDTAFHQTIPVIAHKYAILINFNRKQH
jgi:acetate kinase